MKPIAFILMLACCVQPPAYAAQQIVFNITSKGLPPYMIKKVGQPDSGIMLDVLQLIADKHNYSVKPVGIPKKREISQLDLGKLDAVPLAMEWVPHPENYAFTDPVVKARDVLFSLKSSPVQLNDIKELFGKKLGTHLGYHYPTLEDYFNSNKIQRSDAGTEKEMLGMLIYERTQGAVLNELVGQWLIKNNPLWQHQFYISKQAINQVDYRIMFNKRWHKFVELFNQELAIMKKDGQLKEIISRYQ
ncbi:MAG: transporter substrate-binding domain-containing protein [Bermanella sp.]